MAGIIVEYNSNSGVRVTDRPECSRGMRTQFERGWEERSKAHLQDLVRVKRLLDMEGGGVSEKKLRRLLAIVERPEL